MEKYLNQESLDERNNSICIDESLHRGDHIQKIMTYKEFKQISMGLNIVIDPEGLPNGIWVCFEYYDPISDFRNTDFELNFNSSVFKKNNLFSVDSLINEYPMLKGRLNEDKNPQYNPNDLIETKRQHCYWGYRYNELGEDVCGVKQMIEHNYSRIYYAYVCYCLRRCPYLNAPINE